MKYMKKIISYLILVTMVITMLPYSVFAETEADGASADELVEIEDFPSLPYDIYKNSNGDYYVSDILTTRNESFVNYYVDTENGSDDNAGTSESAPFKTLKKALTASLNQQFQINIINENAVFFRDDLYGEYPLKKSGVIRAENTAMIISGVKEPEFSLFDGYSNTYASKDLSGYKIVGSSGIYGVVDIDSNRLDDYGLYKAYSKVDSIEEVEATESSYFYSEENSTMYVHPENSIDTVHPLTSDYGFRWNLTQSTEKTMLYLENLNIISGFYMGARSAVDESDERCLEFIAENCKFQHNIAADGVPVANYDIAYLIDCTVGFTKADGYNYHASYMSETQRSNTVYAEVNCKAEECGYYTEQFGIASYINNLSTAHEGVNILRLNTTGRNCLGPLIADVNGCRSVCIDCNVINEKYDFNGSNIGCYTFNEGQSDKAGKATLINCYGSDTRDFAYKLYSSITTTEVSGGNLLDSENDYLVTGDLVVPPEHMTISYDDHLDMSGKSVEIIDAGTPTSYQVGYGVEEGTKDTAVVTLEDDVLVATGIGTAQVNIDGQLYEMQVEAAPISMLLLIGQSNMQGSEGNANQSIVCEDGQAYATYGDRYTMTESNATDFAASALTGEKASINVNGTTDNLSGYPIYSLNEEGAGKAGPDSGFAYQWAKETGEKVWVINAAHGGSSIKTWQEDGANYKEAVNLFKACQDTMKAEIEAGHYTLSHMGYYWCQGCADEKQTAEWYVDKYLTMHENLKEDLAFDDDTTFEFGNIVSIQAGHVNATGYRYTEGEYDATDSTFFTTYEELEMRGPRVAQRWMAANPELTDINMVCNLGESWVTMPDGGDGVAEYFAEHYTDGRVDYETQVLQSESWRTPTTPTAVKDSIHYNQIGYNEVGIESVRNTIYLLGIKEMPDIEPEVTFVNWTGYKEISDIESYAAGCSGTLVVPIVEPCYMSKKVTYDVSDALEYDYYDLIDKNGNGGTLTASIGDSTVTVATYQDKSYLWKCEDDVLTSVSDDVYTSNNLTLNGGSITDGIYSSVRYKTDKSISLRHSKPWYIEWTILGAGSGMVMASQSSHSEGNCYIYRNANSLVCLGVHDGQSSNYGFKLSDFGIDYKEEHTYRIENVVTEEGNMPYLYVDGKLLGAMTNYYIGSVYQNSDNDYLSGKDFSFSYIGNSSFPLNNVSMGYLEVGENSVQESGIFQIWRDDEMLISCSSLQEAADAAMDGDTVKIAADYAVTETTTISSNITIDGDGHTIDKFGFAEACFVVEEGADVSFCNMTVDGGATGFEVDYDAVTYTDYKIPLKDGSADNDPKGSEPVIVSNGQLSCENVTVQNCYMTSSGGAVHIASGDATFKNSSFVHNYSKTYGGAIYIGSKFGELTEYPVGSVDIENCTFNENYSGHGGAVYAFNAETLNITSSDFENNTANGGKGGAIDLATENTTKPAGEQLGLDFMQTTVTDCTFVNNWAGNDGFAIQTYDSDLYIKDSVFEKNVGVHPTSSVGTVSIEAYRSEDRIYTSMESCIFTGNIGPVSAYGDHSSQADLDISGCTFTGNQGNETILLYSSVTNMSDTVFKDEKVIYGVVDARIYENYDIPPELTMDGVSFDGTVGATDILVRKQNHNSELNTYNVILKGTTSGNIDIWDANQVTISGTHTGDVYLDSNSSEDNLSVGLLAQLDGEIITNPDTYTVTLIYPYDDSFKTGKFMYLDKDVMYTASQIREMYFADEDFGCLEIYEDSACEAEWDYAADSNMTVYGSWGEHDMIQHEAKVAGCETIGWEAYETCSRCNYTTYEEIAALGHDYEAVVSDPTCTEGGFTTYTCSRCDDEYVADKTPAIGHSYGEWAITTEPTCTEKGHEERVCVCGEIESRDVDVLGHTPGEAATCTTPQVCIVCGAELESALDHDLIQHEAKAAGCETIGWEAYEICSRCDYSTYEEIEALGHDYKAVVTEPTCEEGGYTTYSCNRCDDEYVADETPATGHSYGEWTVTVEPTCTEKGQKVRACACGETEARDVDALGHDYDEEKYQQPTESADGGWFKECDCGDIEWTEVETWNDYVKACVEVTTLDTKATASIKTETITASWTKSGSIDMTRYEVYRSRTGKAGSFGKIGETASLKFEDKTAKAGQTYYYKVCGVKVLDDAAYKTAFSNVVNAKIKKVTASYVKESKMVIRSYYAGRAIKVTWTSPRVKVDGYEIWRSKTLNGKYIKIKTTGTDARQWTNTGLKLQDRWYYKVRGYKYVNGKKVYTQWSKKGYRYVLNAKNAKLANAIEDANAITTKKAVKVNSGIKVTWTKDTSVKCNKYEIWRSSSKNGTYTKIATTGRMSYTDKSGKLKSGKRYYYKIVGYRFFGKACPMTKASNVVSAVR